MILPDFPVKFGCASAGDSVKSKKTKSTEKTRTNVRQKPLDRTSSLPTNPTEKQRGRPPKMPREWVTGRASNYEFQLSEVWPRLEIPLLGARTADEITAAFRESAEPYAAEFVPRLSSDILLLLNDPDFPKRASPRIKFLARSLAGRSQLSFRTSRDICEKAAALERIKSPHRIFRREFYIECSCGYHGPARDNACRKCGAQSPLSLFEWTGRAPLNVSIKRKNKSLQSPQREISPDVAVRKTAESNCVQCECGATIAAATRELALKTLAEHKRLVHPEMTDEQAEEPE